MSNRETLRELALVLPQSHEFLGLTLAPYSGARRCLLRTLLRGKTVPNEMMGWVTIWVLSVDRSELVRLALDEEHTYDMLIGKVMDLADRYAGLSNLRALETMDKILKEANALDVQIAQEEKKTMMTSSMIMPTQDG